jgi:hypothetical protein
LVAALKDYGEALDVYSNISPSLLPQYGAASESSSFL